MLTHPSGKPRFILLDQSLAELGGHYLEYARRVLNAAARDEWQPILVVNRAVNAAVTVDFPILPIFRCGFWPKASDLYGGTGSLMQVLKAASEKWFLMSARLHYSPLAIARSGEIRQALQLAARLRAPGLRGSARLILWAPVALLAIPLILAAIWIRLVVRLALAMGGGSKQDAELLIVRARRYVARSFRTLESQLVALFWRRVHLARRRQFRQDFFKLISRTRPLEQDVILIPTLGIDEVLAIGDLFARCPEAMRCSWHLVFRRNLFEGRDPDYSTQMASLKPLQEAMLRLNSFRCRIRYYTDTEILTSQYNRLGCGVFGTLPVPVATDYYLRTIGRRHRDPGSTFNIVYAGDARTEKGFQHLPHLVSLLSRKHNPNPRFTIQANFNTPDGEAGPIIARSELKALARELPVRLIDRPLNQSEYQDMIAGADAVLILYERDNYYARSSGIFVEAICSGKPVVVPAATWMASELLRPISAYHEDLLKRVPVQGVLHAGDLRWRRPGNRDLKAIGDHLILNQPFLETAADCPDGSDHVLLQTRISSASAGQFLRVTGTCMDSFGNVLESFSEFIGSCKDSDWCIPLSVLIQLPKHTSQTVVRLENAFRQDTLALSPFTLHFLAADTALPRFYAGAVYAEAKDIAGAVSELINHQEHYRCSAGLGAALASKRNSPEELVGMIRTRASDRPNQKRQNDTLTATGRAI